MMDEQLEMEMEEQEVPEEVEEIDDEEIDEEIEEFDDDDDVEDNEDESDGEEEGEGEEGLPEVIKLTYKNGKTEMDAEVSIEELTKLYFEGRKLEQEIMDNAKTFNILAEDEVIRAYVHYRKQGHSPIETLLGMAKLEQDKLEKNNIEEDDDDVDLETKVKREVARGIKPYQEELNRIKQEKEEIARQATWQNIVEHNDALIFNELKKNKYDKLPKELQIRQLREANNKLFGDTARKMSKEQVEILVEKAFKNIKIKDNMSEKKDTVVKKVVPNVLPSRGKTNTTKRTEKVKQSVNFAHHVKSMMEL
jgi:hypothetical protein